MVIYNHFQHCQYEQSSTCLSWTYKSSIQLICVVLKLVLSFFIQIMGQFNDRTGSWDVVQLFVSRNFKSITSVYNNISVDDGISGMSLEVLWNDQRYSCTQSRSYSFSAFEILKLALRLTFSFVRIHGIRNSRRGLLTLNIKPPSNIKVEWD